MIAKLNFYDNQQFTGEPEITCEATAFLYDDNLTFQENCQAVLQYEGRQNIKPQLDFPPSSSDPAFYKRSYCKELWYRVGVVVARFGLIWRQWDTTDVQNFPGNKLYACGVSTTSNIGTPIFVKTDLGYTFNLINGYTGSQGYETNANNLMTWINENPQGSMEAYFKILYSYNEDNETYIRGVIVGFKGYVFGTINDVIRVELSTQFTGQTIIDLEDEPGEDDMKIETPNILDLANRQYVCKRGDVFALFEHICNMPTRMNALSFEHLKAVLGEHYTDWASAPIDVQIFPLVFKTNSGVTQHFVNSNTLNPVRYVYMSPAIVPESEGVLCDFDPDNTGHRIYEIQNSRDVLFNATDWILITRKNNDFTDFEPYCSTKLYLPYVGYVDFDLTIYYGKYIRIKYAVDISNGGCVAFVCISDSSTVSDDGRIVAKFEGSMGVHNPFELTSWGDYYNSVRSTLADSVGIVSTTAGFGFAGLGTAISNSKIRKANRAELDAIGGMVNEKEYINKGTSKVNLSNFNTDVKADQLMNTPNTRSTNSGSCLNGCLNAYGVVDCYMMFYYTITEETTNLHSMRGYPSNKSGKLSEFTGFLQCSDVKLVCPRATESEKTRFVQLLTSGIYI